MSIEGARQGLYNPTRVGFVRAGDPLSHARFLQTIYPKGELVERVRKFLERDDSASEAI